MKKAIGIFSFVIALAAFSSCSSEKEGEFEYDFGVVKSISVDGLDKRTPDMKMDQMTIHVESSETLDVLFNPAYATDKDKFTFTFSSSKPEVASVTALEGDKTAEYKAGKTPGETIITITAINKPEIKFEFKMVVIKKEVEKLTTKGDYSKGMYIKLGTYQEIGELEFTPADASIKEVAYTIADNTLAKVETINIPDGKDKDGKEKTREALVVTSLKAGSTTLTITSKDKPSAKYVINLHIIDSYSLDKSAWTVDLIGYPAVDKANKDAILKADNSFMTLSKPGSTVEVPASTKLSFAFDRKNNEEFTAIQLVHNGKNASERILAVSLSGKTDLLADNWTTIQKDIKITDADKEESVSPLIPVTASSARYIKVDITSWDDKEGSAANLKLNEFRFIGYK